MASASVLDCTSNSTISFCRSADEGGKVVFPSPGYVLNGPPRRMTGFNIKVVKPEDLTTHNGVITITQSNFPRDRFLTLKDFKEIDPFESQFDVKTSTKEFEYTDGYQCIPPIDSKCDNPMGPFSLDEPLQVVLFNVRAELMGYKAAQQVSALIVLCFE